MNERFKFKLDKDKIKLQLRDLGKKLIRKREVTKKAVSGNFSPTGSPGIFIIL